MALSQVQCLDDSHINLRTNESKPEFFYSEDQRLALETLIHAGQAAFEDYIKTNNIHCFLSDLEIERIANSVEVYSPGSPDNYAELCGENDDEEISLQYWPDRSDRSIPRLDIGWPDRASYRGVTRVQVYTQPSYEGQSHIKEVVRKMIGQAHKVIAIVMDLFTDIDIFRDLLDASYRRKVAVYILLETTGVKHFLRMCEKASMHTGHLKNLRVRSIRGTEFFSRSSKKVYGSQSQKFIFIDGDKAVSGSYSFTWSASRLDRNLITVLTGQAVDAFDTLFQDMYVLSNGVCLSKINLSSEPEPEYLPQAVPTLLPSATTALKLINPKYTLVSNCAFTTNGPVSDQTSAKNSTSKNQTDVIKQIRDTPVVPPVHPGLLNLEKANMIYYVPTWPDPDPPSDVIGFINIRDSNKPLQAHLMRSELFEVSQAIRFKDPFNEPKESISLVCPGPISQTLSGPEAPAQKQILGDAQNQDQESSQSEDLVLLLEKPETEYVSGCNKVDKEELCAEEKELDTKSLQRENIHTKIDFPNTTSSFAQDSAVSKTEQSQDTQKPLKCPDQTSDKVDLKSSAVSTEAHLDETLVVSDNTSVKQSHDDKAITDVAPQDHRDTKPKANQNDWNGTQMSNSDSSISSLSDEFYECFSPVAEKTPVSLHNPINDNQEQDALRSKCSAQDCIDLGNNQNFFTPKLLKASCSIVFNFLSAEFKTTGVPSKATFAQERDKGTIINDIKLPVNDSETCYFSQTPNGCLNFSSTSEEYFECSDMVGLKSEIDSMANEEPNSVENVFNQNEQLQIPKPIQEVVKLSELSCQNTKEKNELKMDSGQVQSKSQYALEMTADSQMVTDDFKAVLEAKDYTQTQLDEKVHRHQVQDSKFSSEPIAESESMNNDLQGCKTSASQHFLEIQAKAASVELAKVVPMQLEVSLDLACEKSEIKTLQDLQPDASMESTYKGNPVLLAEVNSKLHFESDVSGDIVCEGQSVKLTEKTAKPPLLDLQTEVNPDIIHKPTGVTANLQSETNSECSVLQHKADVTPAILEKLEVTKSIELSRCEERQNTLTDFDSGSNHPPNLRPEEHVNKLQNESNELNPAVLKNNWEKHNPQEKQYENTELLILEDSDLREMELKLSDTIRPIAALSKKTKLSKTEPIEPKITKATNELKQLKNKLGHNVYTNNGKETCHPTALVEEKQEGEHISANQMYKNLPEAKPKMECVERKQPHQASSRIPIQASRGLTKLPISTPDPKGHSFGLRPPKASIHGYLHRKPLGQNKPSNASPSTDKLSTGGIAPVRSTQIPQRPTSTVPAPCSPTSPTKQPQVQLTAPKIRQSDQTNVSRKRSASITKYNCSTSRISCPAQVKKREFKGSSKQLE